MSKHIICLGEAMAEISRDSNGFHVGFAGDTLNTAVYCKRALSQQGAVSYITRVGQDPLSHALIDFINHEAIETNAIELDQEHPLGIYSIATDANGERSFHYWRADSAARQMFTTSDDAQFQALGKADIIYLSGISIAILSVPARHHLLRALRSLRANAGARIAFDSNYRPRLWENVETARSTIENFWRITDIALPSVDDEMALFGDASPEEVVARIEAWGAKTGALKRGSIGPLPIGEQPILTANYPPANNVVDSTAAGDSFNGAFLASHACEASLSSSLSAAHEMARQVVGHRGAIIPALDG